MKKLSKNVALNGAYRIIDANYNRAKEGLRVCEELARFILNNAKLTSELKSIRHSIADIINKHSLYPGIIKERESLHDVGKNIYGNELRRQDINSIFYANIQRVKESIRVLEEFSKLFSQKLPLGFKELRYKIYAVEAKIARNFPPVPYFRQATNRK